MSAPASPTVPKRKPLILVADDDPEIRKLIERVLTSKYRVTAVADGPSAIAAASRPTYPDLLILDVMMPGLDGFDVAARVRSLPNTQKVPILFVTARDTPMDKIRGIQCGARSYITKPFRMDELLSKVSAALRD